MIDLTFSIYQADIQHWKCVPLSYVCTEVRKRNSVLLEDNLLSLSYGKIVRKDITTPIGLLPESFDGYNIVEPGDIVLRLTDLQNDKRSLRTGLVQERGIITSAYTTIRSTGVDARWLAYTLHSYDLQKVFYSLGSGLRQSMKFEDLKSLAIAVPPLDEQRRIADYLDSKIDTLDRLTYLNRSLLLQNSQNLNSSIDQEFNATGATSVELRRVVKFTSKKKIDFLPTVSLDLVIAKRGSLNVSELPFTNGETSTWMDTGDVGFGKLRPYLGKVFLAEVPTFAESEFVVMSPEKNRLWPRYFRNFLLTRMVLDELESLSVGAKMPRTSWDQISTLRIPIPPIEQQMEICQRILELESRAALKDSYLEQMLGKISEYKTSLITSAVTGTFDVTTGRSVA